MFLLLNGQCPKCGNNVCSPLTINGLTQGCLHCGNLSLRNTPQIIDLPDPVFVVLDHLKTNTCAPHQMEEYRFCLSEPPTFSKKDFEGYPIDITSLKLSNQVGATCNISWYEMPLTTCPLPTKYLAYHQIVPNTQVRKGLMIPPYIHKHARILLEVFGYQFAAIQVGDWPKSLTFQMVDEMPHFRRDSTIITVDVQFLWKNHL